MEGYCSTGQIPQWAVVPVEEEEGDTSSDIAPILSSITIDLFGRLIREVTGSHTTTHHSR
jgi:hypothetical protein